MALTKKGAEEKKNGRKRKNGNAKKEGEGAVKSGAKGENVRNGEIEMKRAKDVKKRKRSRIKHEITMFLHFVEHVHFAIRPYLLVDVLFQKK